VTEPVVELDPVRIERNIARFHGAAEAAAGGVVGVRAHVKAHRCPEVTRLQLAAGAKGIAVHSAAEAALHVDAGATDVVVAWPWKQEWRAYRFAELARRCRVTVHADTAEMITALGEAAVASGIELGVRIEVDTGRGRVGVPPGGVAGLAELAGATRGVRLDGVTGYHGLSSAEEVARRAELDWEIAGLIVSAAEAVRAAGLECPSVCVGGTPAASTAFTVPGVTEVCAGAYATYDAGMADIGVCGPEDVAVVVHGDATELLKDCDQPWAPGVTSRRVDASTVQPAHICPIATRVSSYRVGSAEWSVHCLPDRQ
jgi:D-serine deaminase-like pyridoxal phosphate-dependent protein